MQKEITIYHEVTREELLNWAASMEAAVELLERYAELHKCLVELMADGHIDQHSVADAYELLSETLVDIGDIYIKYNEIFELSSKISRVDGNVKETLEKMFAKGG